MFEYILASAIGSLCGAGMTYVVLKKLFNDAFLIEKIDVITTEICSDEELQRKLYSIGALLGNGIASGAGFQKKGGKYGLQDLLMQVAGQWFANKQQKPDGGTVFGQTS